MACADADVELDFYGDWLETLRGALRTLRYQVPSDDHDMQIAYFNVLKRLVPVQPRAVHVAPTLVCPPAVQAGYDEVKRKVEAGEDLRPHLSRRLASRDFNDLLLNDWGIHHLHLGTVVGADGFVARTGPVLFARFLPDNAYFIAVLDHCSRRADASGGPWSDIQILESFAAAWPEQMRRFEMPGIAPSAQNPTRGEIAKARAAGVQPVLTIRGMVVFPMGGGLTTAKVAVEVVTRMDNCVGIVRSLEEQVAQAKQKVFDEAARHSIELVRPTRFRLVLQGDGSAFATTEDSRFGFPVGQIVRW